MIIVTTPHPHPQLIHSDRKSISGLPGDGSGRDQQGHKETLRGGGYALCLDHECSFRGVYIYQNLSVIHFKYVQLSVCQLYLSKLLKKSHISGQRQSRNQNTHFVPSHFPLTPALS